jgi:hypothetical protein
MLEVLYDWLVIDPADLVAALIVWLWHACPSRRVGRGLARL